jgi:pentafunctional AROM polypeptide
LNFGHTVGHAIEAILSPEMLHGECIAIGSIYEAQIARNMGFLNDMSVGRLTRVFQAYGLPISLSDSRVQKIPKKCCVDNLLEFMCVDKKNIGSEKRIVMLSGIGKTAEQRASFVPDSVIRKILCPSIAVIPLRPTFCASQQLMRVPGSKSISNRALVLAALGEGECRLHGLLHSDDVQVMLDALQKLVGISYSWEEDGGVLVITGGGGRLRVPEKDIYLGNAGTASRFLTTVSSLISYPSNLGKSVVLTGNARMKQRPIGPLAEALTANGCDIQYLEKMGSLPIKITPNGHGLRGGLIHLSASISSQYVSSILMAAPYASEQVVLSLEGDSVISQPYIDMTIAMMKSFGINVEKEIGKDRYIVPQGVYKNPPDYFIEADASSATYPLAFAAITGTRITVTNIGSNSLQGDADFATKVLQRMGCTVEQTETTTTVCGPSELEAIPNIDMTTMTDAFLTASILAAVASKGPSMVTKITGIANQRVKECNRIAAMVEQLSKFGVEATELDDGIQITAISKAQLRNPPGGVECYDDHRIAMSFSILSCVLPLNLGFTVINEKKCVEKTWPGWWDTLENVLGLSLSGVDPGNEILPTPTSDISGFSNDSSIVLIGMRGAGKTTLGKFAAHVLGFKFIDIDEYVENLIGKKINDIVKDEGWEAFRRYETESLKEIMSHNAFKCVISCGGKFRTIDF